jgi:hypothetical protein
MFSSGGAMSAKHEPHDDALDLEAIDQRIRINELTEEVRALGMGDSGASEDCPPGIHEQFLKNIIDYESAPVSSPFARLEAAGVRLPAPDALDDAALHDKLWELINALAAQDTELHSTDHLSDRALYERLWSDVLREEYPMMPVGSGWVNNLDMIGSGSEEDIQISLRYYSTDEDRQHWADDFPDLNIPPREPKPYDRDRLLPRIDRGAFEGGCDCDDECDDGLEEDQDQQP